MPEYKHDPILPFGAPCDVPRGRGVVKHLSYPKGGNEKVPATDRCLRLSNIYVILPSIHSLMINCCGLKWKKEGKKRKVENILAVQCTCVSSFSKLKCQKYALEMNKT